jgi:hypothetical protein
MTEGTNRERPNPAEKCLSRGYHLAERADSEQSEHRKYCVDCNHFIDSKDAIRFKTTTPDDQGYT